MIILDYKPTPSEKATEPTTKPPVQKSTVRTIFALLAFIIAMFILEVTIQNATGRETAPGWEIEHESVSPPTTTITIIPENPLVPAYVLRFIKQ